MKTLLHNQFCKIEILSRNRYFELLFNKEYFYLDSTRCIVQDKRYKAWFLEICLKTNVLTNWLDKHNLYAVGNGLELNNYKSYLTVPRWKEIKPK